MTAADERRSTPSESTATWVEDKVYPDVNDYLGYIRSFAEFPGEPITSLFPSSQDKSLRIYGTAVWNHWLDGGGGGYGDRAIRRAWELSGRTNPPDFALAAYNSSIERSGGRGFSREFVPFCAATAEWRTGFGGFPDHERYPDVKRKGSLAAGARKAFKLDHTAYRLLDIRPRGKTLKLTVDAEKGVRSGIALVARDGDSLAGKVTARRAYLKQGGRASVTLENAGRYKRITAVVVNADDRIKGAGRTDWNYTRDGAAFDV